MLLIDDLSLYQDGVPHGVYDRLRTGQSIFYNTGENPFYAVLRHAEAATVLQDTANYSSALQGILIEDVSAEMRPVMRAMSPSADPPKPTEIRRKLSPPLLPNNLGN